MKDSYLEVTFRHGKQLAAYLYLPRGPGAKSYRSRRAGPGLVIDYSRGGKPIGIEITAPGQVTVVSLNRVLRELGMPTIKRVDLEPLQAA